mmetsp:Transcript_33993/g.79172  ORF Transcript_33993/g.79172 Transcript_33993/m.79172 type:complete len:247 (-) Transcript_33993:856-1596(-)
MQPPGNPHQANDTTGLPRAHMPMPFGASAFAGLGLFDDGLFDLLRIVGLLRGFLLRAAPVENDLVVPSAIHVEHPRPLLHEHSDVFALLHTLAVPDGHSSALVGGMPSSDKQPVTAEYAAVGMAMTAGVVIVLFQSHRLVEAHLRLVRDEEVAQDEVVLGIFLRSQSQRVVAGREDTAQLWLVRAGPHLGEQKLCGCQRGDRVGPHSFDGLVGLREGGLAAVVLLLTVVVLPLGDVVTHLHADETL